jgi:hypothetical protein
MKLGLVDVLKMAGFDPTVPTKLVRHQDRRYPVEELRRVGALERYQEYQGKPKFHGASQIVSFYGLPGTRAGFYGVYKVKGVSNHEPIDGPVVEAYPKSAEWNRDAKFIYELERDTRFDGLRDRIIIDWGAGALAWVQNLDNKEVVEVLPHGRALPPFEDYLEFSLTYDQLIGLFENAEAHRDWRVPLCSVGGVYLVLAEKAGDLYVGSAYGVGGIWGRWESYARTGHGGNAQLKELMEKDNDYPRRFRFSVLQTLPRTLSFEQVIRRERMFKDKLGTRTKGLNLN